MVEPYTEFSLEAPGGEVKVRAQCSNGRGDKVYLTPQPSYLAVADAMVCMCLKPNSKDKLRISICTWSNCKQVLIEML